VTGNATGLLGAADSKGRAEERLSSAAVEGLAAQERRGRRAAYWQAAPFALVFLVFFLVPLGLTLVVSFWEYNEYEVIPAATLQNYGDIFDGCVANLPDLCLVFKTYLSTAKFCVLVWGLTLVIGFTVAYFVAFHVRSATVQTALFLICTIPFWTSNVIRMISWVPLLGRNGLVN